MTTKSEATQAACPLDCKVMPHTLLHGDCLDLMALIPDGSVDLILCDLPYGTTACKWDTIIPLEPLWREYRRVIKAGGAIVLHASQPFTSVLTCSNLAAYNHRWCWDKVKPASGLNAKKSPLRNMEDILVFCYGAPTYNPQMYPKKSRAEKKNDRNGEAFGNARVERYHDNKGLGYPKELITISNADQRDRLHPTQKPVDLAEYLIRTYSNEWDIVLDNCMGSGTTGIACLNTGRNFIGIEKDAYYFEIARNRIMGHNAELTGGRQND